LEFEITDQKIAKSAALSAMSDTTSDINRLIAAETVNHNT